jgi:cathepsin H
MVPRSLFSCSGKDGLFHDTALEEMKEMFQFWKLKYGKSYSTLEEESSRFEIFRQNLRKIHIHNSDESRTFDMGLNKFADWTWDEFKLNYLAKPQNCSATSTSSSLDSPSKITNYRLAAPQSIDWRDAGAVSPVKDQGNCGSCWTFSTTGCLESHHYIKTGTMTLFSEQQLVDCAYNFNNFGCNGGLPSQAFEYIRYNGGIESEDSYPYLATDGTCSFDSSKVAGTVSNVFNITFQDENQIVNSVGLIGPVSIAYEVLDSFMLYSSGVYSSAQCSTSPTDVNHAVLAVGYNTDAVAGDYWIVKNSWSTDWGIDGYFYIERGVNMCGLADCASFPIV